MSNSDDQAGRPTQEHYSSLQSARDNDLATGLGSPSETSKAASPRQGYQQFVFADPVAFRYLEEDPATVVLERRRRLQGYEIYVVEQWACSRVHPTFVIATYTGDFAHSILVGVLSVPKDETVWSSRLTVYFRAMCEYHARKKETPAGILMVTNLSGFPSSLTVIPVPDGDIRKHRKDFIVNENLKRLGCAGRGGLNLQNPQPSTAAKFHHLYRTSEAVPLYTSVMELVKICQVSLSLYGKLAPVYADGLLCDVTEKSIINWWSDIGTYIYDIEPNDGILGPSTLSALVGLLMGAFNRMKAIGAPVGKDVFDIASTKRAIGHFQKTQRMEQTRRLDRQTLRKLHKITAKAANGEGWTVPKAVKSTVAELSGKGGEMVMGIVGGRDKAGIADVETLDVERFAELVTGTKARWLWQGKVGRSNDADTSGSFGPSDQDKIFGTDDQGNYLWTSKHRDSVWTDGSLRRPGSAGDADNRSGFGRFKDAVGITGLRSHQPRPSKDDSRPDLGQAQDTHQQYNERAPRSSLHNPPTEVQVKNPASRLGKIALETPSFDLASPLKHNMSQTTLHGESAPSQTASEDHESGPVVNGHNSSAGAQNGQRLQEELKPKMSSDTYNRVFADLDDHASQSLGLRRTQSAMQVTDVPTENPCVNHVPRYLSFSVIENIAHGWEDMDTNISGDTVEAQKVSRVVAGEEAKAALVRTKAEKITYLERVIVPFAERQVSDVDALDRLTQKNQDELSRAHYERLGGYQAQKVTSAELIADERHGLSEGLRRVEMLGAKLDYELNALNSRIKEVEDGVAEFERAVVHIEDRVHELDDNNLRDPWWLSLRRFLWSGNS